MDDSECLRQIAHGHRRSRELAAQLLFERYARPFFGRLRSWGVSELDCEDLIQELFLRLLQSKDLAAVRSPAAYMWRMIHNVFADHCRRKGRPIATLESQDSYEIDTLTLLERIARAPNLEGSIELEECIDRAWSALEDLAPAKAHIIKLVVCNDFNGRELAESVGRTYGATREFLHQARRTFQEILERLCPGLIGDVEHAGGS